MEKFCAEIMSCARKLGFFVREQEVNGSSFFEFVDPDTKVIIKGQPNSNKKVALTAACQTLVKYFDIKAP